MALKPGDPNGRDPGLGPAGEHDVGSAEPDHVGGLSDRHVRGRAGGALRGQRPARPELHRDPGRAHVRDDLRDRERVDPVGSPLEQARRSSPGTPSDRRSRSQSRRRSARPPAPPRAPSPPRPVAPQPRSSARSGPCGAPACDRSSVRGSNSFSSHANVTGYALASHCTIGAAPDFPAIRFFHEVSTSLPSGVTAPRPVMTTRARPFCVYSVTFPTHRRRREPHQ